MRARTPIFAFNGGEISRRMEGRSDLDGIYDRAVAQMLNFVATVEGPAMKRPGFRFIRAEDPTAGWVSRFVFNTTQAYVLLWLDGKVRFYTNGGRIELAGVPYEVAVPYTAAEASRLSIKQSYDRLYIAHPNHPPATLTRTGAETFVYAADALTNGPFKDFNTDKAKTVTWTGDGAVDGVATIAANFDLFEPAHVGAPIIFEVASFSNIPAWEPLVRTDSLALGALRRSDGKVYELDSLGTVAGTNEYTGTIEPTHTSGSEWDGSQQIIAGTVNDNAGVRWKYRYDRFGVGIIQEILTSVSATVKVTRALPDLAEATWRWAHGAFSNKEGWPQLVDVWGQRKIFWKGLELAGSVTGDYSDFSPIDKSGIFAADQGFRRLLDAADPPIWSHADKEYLLAGTASGELVVGQINRAAGLSSDNLRGDLQSSYGSTPAWPVAIGTSILFVQRGGRKIREAEFSYTQERFIGANINIYARHITRSGIKWLAFQQESEEMLWGGRGDGTLIAHPHSPEQQIKGFARAELAAGTALCGVTIPSEDGQRDELWILADLNGQRGMLQLADWWDEDAGLEMDDAFFVDWGVSYDGNALDGLGAPLGPKQDFTEGLSHLEGLAVRILADGVVIDDLTVTGGALSLPKPAMKVHIGLGYQARIKLLRPEMRGGGTTLQGIRKRMIRLCARLIDTASLLFQDHRGNQGRFFDRSNDLPMNSPPPLWNGDTDNIPAGDGSDFDATGELVNDDPLPAIISQLLPTYELEELQK